MREMRLHEEDEGEEGEKEEALECYAVMDSEDKKLGFLGAQEQTRSGGSRLCRRIPAPAATGGAIPRGVVAGDPHCRCPRAAPHRSPWAPLRPAST